jgi:uncharacterized membrane protein
MLIVHFIGLAMGLGTSFAHMFLGFAAEKMTAEEAAKFRLHTLILARMGHIGITLLIVSGIYLILPFWNTLPENPLLITKLVLVVLLIILISLISIKTKKAKAGDPSQFKQVAPLGKMTLVTALVIVIVAVLIFH